jgi:choline dehydrogenase-like flavoprotein
VEWHATDTILGAIYQNPMLRERFQLLTNCRVTRVAIEGKKENGEYQIGASEVKDLLKDTRKCDPNFYVRAKAYVIASGAVATPQVRSPLYLFVLATDSFG